MRWALSRLPTLDGTQSFSGSLSLHPSQLGPSVLDSSLPGLLDVVANLSVHISFLDLAREAIAQ